MEQLTVGIRREQEIREHECLSPFASFSDESRGREREEAPCDIRMCYQRDRDRVVHSKAFRRLKDKTQVFLAPEGDHYRTRLTHTLEVGQIARTIARALRLNEDLTEAIALAHDLGHTPFGHAGERALARVCPGGFEHNEQSIRVVSLLEKHGQGLNLTWEVRDGILNHQTKGRPATLEGKVVRFADKIAYLYHDTDDAVRAHIIPEGMPEEFRDVFGNTTKGMLNTIIHDIIRESRGKNDIRMSDTIGEAMQGMRRHMFAHVYTNPVAKGQEYKAEGMVEQLYEYYRKDTGKLPEEYRELIEKRGELPERVVCDYIAGMTDRYATTKFKEIMIPSAWGIY
ncbi:MAG: deoxyguanosinetriphosphate triphosphohydrolase [Lachnospiraceae bacterium]|nr:deoxyguanosinetriphosphate triphosphohydrolase [Lachnospiraceae bacterium]